MQWGIFSVSVGGLQCGYEVLLFPQKQRALPFGPTVSSRRLLSRHGRSSAMMLSTYACLPRSVPVLELIFSYSKVFIFGLWGVIFNRDSHRSAGRCDRYRSTIDHRSINDRSDYVIDRWLIDDALDRSMIGRRSRWSIDDRHRPGRYWQNASDQHCY
jgi:hypothetical protein